MSVQLKLEVGNPEPFLALTLFMFFRGADYKNFAVTANDLAVVTTLLNGGAYFHCLSLKSKLRVGIIYNDKECARD